MCNSPSPPPPQPTYWEIFSTNLTPIVFTTLTYFHLSALIFISENLSSYLSEFTLICQNLFLFVKTHFYLSEPVFICQNPLLFVRTYFHLWESLLIYDHLWESIFLSLYENKQVYEYHNLKQIFYHQNIITIFC